MWTLLFWDDWGDWNNYGNQAIDKVLGWAACQWMTSLQFCLKPYWLLSANCASKQSTISQLSTNWYWDLWMSNTTCSVNFFLNTHQLSLCIITVFIQVESTVTHTCSFHLWVLLLLMTSTLEQEQHWLEEPLWSVSDNPNKKKSIKRTPYLVAI